MHSLMQNGRKPKPNGEPGYVLTYDPDHKSFKESLVAIIFSGIYLEALLHQLIVERKGIDEFKKVDFEIYEAKLKLLNCNDTSIINECEHYRNVRNELAHEKAYDEQTIRRGQTEATRAFNMIKSINTYFDINME